MDAKTLSAAEVAELKRLLQFETQRQAQMEKGEISTFDREWWENRERFKSALYLNAPALIAAAERGLEMRTAPGAQT